MSSYVINYFLGKRMFSLHVIQTDLNLLEAWCANACLFLLNVLAYQRN